METERKFLGVGAGEGREEGLILAGGDNTWRNRSSRSQWVGT